MPTTINGFGTSFCKSAGFARFAGNEGSSADCDGFVCFVVLFFPLVPISPIHSFEWSGNQYRSIAIRWSPLLLTQAFLRRWSILLLIAGAVFLEKEAVTYAAVGTAMLVLFVSVWIWLFVGDLRNRTIRQVLGRGEFGSSDPITWPMSIRSSIRSPSAIFGTPTYASAVPGLLDRNCYSQAILAARLEAAIGDQITGEHMTDLVLNDPRVKAALATVKRAPERWNSLMLGNERRPVVVAP